MILLQKLNYLHHNGFNSLLVTFYHATIWGFFFNVFIFLHFKNAFRLMYQCLRLQHNKHTQLKLTFITSVLLTWTNHTTQESRELILILILQIWSAVKKKKPIFPCFSHPQIFQVKLLQTSIYCVYMVLSRTFSFEMRQPRTEYLHFLLSLPSACICVSFELCYNCLGSVEEPKSLLHNRITFAALNITRPHSCLCFSASCSGPCCEAAVRTSLTWTCPRTPSLTGRCSSSSVNPC